MGWDYYRILEIAPNSTDADINKAFRKLALRYHSKKRSAGDEIAAEKFFLICEAYDVLSDECKRATYDQFGEEGLKRGVPTGSQGSGAWTQGYSFHGDVKRVFREFFGGDNPYKEYYDRIDGDLSMGFGGLKGIGAKKQDPPDEKILWLDLSEVFHGCTKKMKIMKKVLNKDERTTSVQEKILTITVKRGWKEGTRITFPQEGDQSPNNIPADVIFILRDKPHPNYRREGYDLIYTTPITLHHALTGTTLDINTVDDRILHIPLTDIIKPGYTRTVIGEGMPLPNDPSKKGDMIIHFNIEFPTSLSSEKKQLIRFALPKHLLKTDAGADDEETASER
ncbi:hypothetical protein HELRODRAFT_82787 [Helobdella robusta]|uniref:J domain-containing protein n=1 Tax=Helobdella robusta TaxID=6412 RepID=T1G4W7_HELRO|nr:hypothetical protein HELRODRAFT_82787 [Helobdella robusta]ESO00553.1 hypothetical protein HELRODRAFT_82787 [Helobdella robusta]